MKWREYRKTASVEAVQLPEPEPAGALPSTLSTLRSDGKLMVSDAGRGWIVLTDEGALAASPGDFLARDPDTGSVWPVEKETFRRTYARVHQDGTVGDTW